MNTQIIVTIEKIGNVDYANIGSIGHPLTKALVQVLEMTEGGTHIIKHGDILYHNDTATTQDDYQLMIYKALA